MVNEYLTIFGVGFLTVFVAGFQSRNVNNGDYGWAAATSFALGLTNAILWTKITDLEATGIGGAVYGLAGALAITSSMYVHKRFIQKDTNA